jgi:hypothetical protein
MNRLLPCALALVAIVPFASISKGEEEMIRQTNTSAERQAHPYVGMWVTADRRVRHNLLPNGRYDEARGNRESAYQGRYEVRGNEIFYWDDSGFTADGTFIDDVLHHGGMILYRSN